MTVVVRWGEPGRWPAAGAQVAMVKGAPSVVVARCRWALRGGEVVPLDSAGRAAAEAEAGRLAAAGHRVLAVACREAAARPFDAALEQDLVLLDDDFASLVTAIEEGRSLFRNVRKFLAYILTSNVPELVPFLAMVALRIPPALTILQILAVDQWVGRRRAARRGPRPTAYLATSNRTARPSSP